jgi:hypothetical protein
MKFTLITALAGTAHAQFCPEAARFGIVSVKPKTVKVGQVWSFFLITIRISNDIFSDSLSPLTCPPQLGTNPKYIDYFLEVPADKNNGHQPDIYFGRSTFDVKKTPKLDIVHTKVIIFSLLYRSRS